MAGIDTVNEYRDFSPARVNANCADDGDAVQPAGRSSESRPSGAAAFAVSSTSMFNRFVASERGTIACRGEIVTPSPGTMASSRMT